MFPSKRGIFWNGTSGGHNKKRIFSTLTQRNTPAGPRPSPTQGKKTLSRYLTSDTCLSHLLPKDGALHWEDVPVGVHGAVGQCWSWVPQSWNDCGMTLIHTGGFGGGSSGASCIKPWHLAESSEHLAAKTSTGCHLKVFCSSLSLKPVQLCKDRDLPRRGLNVSGSEPVYHFGDCRTQKEE